jgi:hypothetical protein
MCPFVHGDRNRPEKVVMSDHRPFNRRDSSNMPPQLAGTVFELAATIGGESPRTTSSRPCLVVLIGVDERYTQMEGRRSIVLRFGMSKCGNHARLTFVRCR